MVVLDCDLSIWEVDSGGSSSTIKCVPRQPMMHTWGKPKWWDYARRAVLPNEINRFTRGTREGLPFLSIPFCSVFLLCGRHRDLGVTSIRENRGLGRWFHSWKHLQQTLDQFPALTHLFTTIYDSSFKNSDALFCCPRVPSACTQCTFVHIGKCSSTWSKHIGAERKRPLSTNQWAP